MSSVNAREGALFFDSRYRGDRCREYTRLSDTPANRKWMQKALDKPEQAIATGAFHYAEFFPGSKLAAKLDVNDAPAAGVVAHPTSVQTDTPLFRTFMEGWFSVHYRWVMAAG